MNALTPPNADSSSTPYSPRGNHPPKPKPFHMTEPFLDRGLWCFWLTADDAVLHYVSHLNCILPPQYNPFHRRPQSRLLFMINPRYDHQEAWLWIYDQLEVETQNIELSEQWVEAVEQSEDDCCE